MLLDAGADKKAKDDNSNRPLDVICVAADADCDSEIEEELSELLS